jgi:DNA (cytosine-5)-methyltransferase 1
VRELSLFSGAGGGLLGSKYFLGWETIGYVEYEEYCQKVLKQRIEDGLLDAAPIFGDIRAFISEGYAESYKGMVDVITGGFPCQPFSVAGKGLGEDDPRNMWPSTIECIRIIRPQFAFLENVPGLLTNGYIKRIFGDLAESGYDVRWRVLSAAEVGAKTLRNRLWIVGHNRSLDVEGLHIHKRAGTKNEFRGPTIKSNLQDVEASWLMANGYTTRDFDDVAGAMDRIKAIGNGQVPQCMARAWELLTEDLK